MAGDEPDVEGPEPADDTAAAAPADPLAAWLAAVQGFGPVARLGQEQWQATLDATAMLAKLPLANLEQSARELARMREAVGVMQVQLAGFDQQLAALEALVRPLVDWARIWSPGR